MLQNASIFITCCQHPTYSKLGANYKVRHSTVFSNSCYFFPQMFKFLPQSPFSHTRNKFLIHKEKTGTAVVNYILHKMHTIRHKSYRSLRKLLRIPASRCHPQEVAYTKVYKHQRNHLGSEMHSVRIFQILKLKITTQLAAVIILRIRNSLTAPRETCRSFVRFMYDLYLIVCAYWWIWLDVRIMHRIIVSNRQNCR